MFLFSPAVWSQYNVEIYMQFVQLAVWFEGTWKKSLSNQIDYLSSERYSISLIVLPSLKLTQHLQMDGWNTISYIYVNTNIYTYVCFLLGWPISKGHVRFNECLFGRQVTCDTRNSVTCSSHKCDAKIPSLVAVQPLKNKKKWWVEHHDVWVQAHL